MCIRDRSEPYYNAMCNTPDGDLLEDCTVWARSSVLRIVVDAFFWIVVAGVQVFYNKFFVYRYYKHPSVQLLDIMSLANVSAWILPDKYAGYYLHGQSALQHSDTALCEFSELLANEEENIGSNRGLLPESDLQEFIMFVSTSSRDKYDRFLEQIRELQVREKESLTFIKKVQQEFHGRRHQRFIKPGSSSLVDGQVAINCLLYTSPSPRDRTRSRMPSSA
eukprot:TRINITY_DN11607_c0_g1_i1.p1 TRINITY_DN11607_c0_g1~~TRINITY_DN11607_c0_g1_i1.p1  ORF type:complete len:221 (-),score=87.99 TRINITY_DN11607_c0_g1_i1:40-702(-)